MIRRLLVLWRAFLSLFSFGYKRPLTDTEAIASDWRAVGDDLRTAMGATLPPGAEFERLETNMKPEAEERLRQAMKRYGLTERDRRHQAGRES